MRLNQEFIEQGKPQEGDIYCKVGDIIVMTVNIDEAVSSSGLTCKIYLEGNSSERSLLSGSVTVDSTGKVVTCKTATFTGPGRFVMELYGTFGSNSINFATLTFVCRAHGEP